jgi:hypothetical protein
MFEAGIDGDPGLGWRGKDAAAAGAVSFPFWSRVVALVTAAVAAAVAAAAAISTAMATTITAAVATTASATVRSMAR